MGSFRLCITFLLASFSLSLFAAPPRYDRVRIHLDATHTILSLAVMGLEVDHGDYRKGVSFTSDFSEQEIQKLKNAGYTYDLLISDVSSYYANQNNQAKSNPARATTCNAAAPFSVPTPANFTTGSMGGFYTYQEMLNVLDSMRAKFPMLISARQQIDTFRSIEGRPLYWLRISNHPDSAQTSKPQILYTALHHAREPAGLTDMVFYMWYLLENYQTDLTVQALVNNTEMYILPCVNPDGYIYNETTNPNGGGMWRKNRRLNNDATYGVDLNRNYGYNWGYDNVGSSNITTDDTYRGTAGFSEPEIQATKWFSENHNFRIAVNYHTYGNLLVYPWGYIASLLTPDSVLFEAYAANMTKTNSFGYGTGDQTVGYITNGDSDDWMYGDQSTKNKIFSMTPESGDNAYGFWPPSSAIIDVCNQNFDLIYSAHKFLLKYIAITDRSSQVVTSHQFWFKYDAQRLGLDSPGTYNINLVSSDPNVTVPATSHSVVNPALMGITTDSFFVQLNPSIVNGNTFSFNVVVSNGLYTYQDTITKKFIGGDTLFYSNCNSITDYSPTFTWGVTTASYTSPSGSITDSPNGNYADNSNGIVTLNTQIDLTNATYATLLYQAKWQIEKGYDYTLVEASSDNQSSWSALCGLYTNIGTNQNDPTDNLYDGYQLNWVQEAVDLSLYLGQKINIRFHLVSDAFVNYDGFYFDDLTVLGNLSNATSVPKVSDENGWQLFPNPASDRVSVRPVELNGEQVTIYNSLGALINKTIISDSELDISTLEPCIYFVSIHKEGDLPALKKLIITR